MILWENAFYTNVSLHSKYASTYAVLSRLQVSTSNSWIRRLQTTTFTAWVHDIHKSAPPRKRRYWQSKACVSSTYWTTRPESSRRIDCGETLKIAAFLVRLWLESQRAFWIWLYTVIQVPAHTMDTGITLVMYNKSTVIPVGKSNVHVSNPKIIRYSL